MGLLVTTHKSTNSSYVESQVLHQTPKSSFSSWDEKLQSYIFRTIDLSFFVNSNEWHLDTSAGANGSLMLLWEDTVL
ncbi:unnamed protein product [Arabidopsis thaliana]|uniref:Uncharacterized protein n=1 Tax=Arabidopsis thaliana TaxID=3702 RepID=A0A654G7F1_ARATH|nr:unnamed protein product [Arabidopsis thaliana]